MSLESREWGTILIANHGGKLFQLILFLTWDENKLTEGRGAEKNKEEHHTKQQPNLPSNAFK